MITVYSTAGTRRYPLATHMYIIEGVIHIADRDAEDPTRTVFAFITVATPCIIETEIPRTKRIYKKAKNQSPCPE